MENSGDWFSHGVNLFEDKDYPGAITAFDKAISFNQHPVDAWFNRGLVYAEMGHYRQALASFDETLCLNPDHGNAKTARIMVMERMQNQVSAAPAPLAALTSRKTYPDARVIQQQAASGHGAPVRNPFIAAILSFFFPGWGQWYNGRRLDGLLFFGAWVLLGLADVVLAVLLKFNPLVSGLFMIAGAALWLFCILNAYSTAVRINEGGIVFMRKSRLFWVPVLFIALLVVLFLFAIFIAFIFGMTANPYQISSSSLPVGSATYSTRVVAATVMQPDQDTIIVTYHGGPDAQDVRQVLVIVSDPSGNIQTTSLGTPADKAPLSGGTSATFAGSFEGKDRVLASAVFSDGTSQVILDSYI